MDASAAKADLERVRRAWALKVLSWEDGEPTDKESLERVRLKTKELYKRASWEKRADDAKKVLEAFEVVKKAFESSRAAQRKSSKALGSSSRDKAQSGRPGSTSSTPAKASAGRTLARATSSTAPVAGASTVIPGTGSKAPAKDRDRFRKIAGTDHAPALADAARKLAADRRRPKERAAGGGLVCACGETCKLQEKPSMKGDVFVCPACRVREMDPIKPLLPGKKGLLKLLYMRPPLLPADARLHGSFRLKMNLPNLRQWKKLGRQIEVRTCILENCEPNQAWPVTLTCRVNKRVAFEVKAPKAGHKRRDVPANLSHALRPGQNTLDVSLQDTNINRFVVAFVVCAPKLPREILPSVACMSEEECKRKVSQLLFSSALEGAGAEVQCDGADRCSLLCPVTLMRMETPVRGHSCKHLQCFDLVAYLVSNSRMAAFNKRWRCPVCNLALMPPDDLFIDTHILQILSQTEPDDEEIAFDTSGNWTVTAKAGPPPSPSSDEEEACIVAPSPKRKKEANGEENGHEGGEPHSGGSGDENEDCLVFGEEDGSDLEFLPGLTPGPSPVAVCLDDPDDAADEEAPLPGPTPGCSPMPEDSDTELVSDHDGNGEGCAGLPPATPAPLATPAPAREGEEDSEDDDDEAEVEVESFSKPTRKSAAGRPDISGAARAPPEAIQTDLKKKLTATGGLAPGNSLRHSAPLLLEAPVPSAAPVPAPEDVLAACEQEAPKKEKKEKKQKALAPEEAAQKEAPPGLKDTLAALHKEKQRNEERLIHEKQKKVGHTAAAVVDGPSTTNVVLNPPQESADGARKKKLRSLLEEKQSKMTTSPVIAPVAEPKAPQEVAGKAGKENGHAKNGSSDTPKVKATDEATAESSSPDMDKRWETKGRSRTEEKVRKESRKRRRSESRSKNRSRSRSKSKSRKRRRGSRSRSRSDHRKRKSRSRSRRHKDRDNGRRSRSARRDRHASKKGKKKDRSESHSGSDSDSS